MFHYFEAITNTSGQSLIGYFARVIDPTTGAVVPLASDIAETPIVTVSGVADMAKTDSEGNLSLYVTAGTYHLDLYAADATTFLKRVQNIAMTGAIGPTGPVGPSNNTRATLAALKAASTTELTSLYDGNLWTWTLGDYTGLNDDRIIVKADSTAINVGAWVRGGSILSATSFGAVFNTIADDSAPLQLAINAAHALGLPLLLPGRTALINTALDLKGKFVDIRGVPGLTQLLAGTNGMTLIDAESTSDTIVSPFSLYGVTINGNSKASYGIRARYRHHSRIDTCNIIACTTGLWEKDTWLSRRSQVRIDTCTTGWQLEGSNHSSIYSRCSISGCSTAHLVINNNGSQPDGNVSLAFLNCDIESGAGTGVTTPGAANSGVGIQIASGCSASWRDGYLGENINGRIILNNGGLLRVVGGTCWTGYTTNSYLVEPAGAGGIATFEGGVQINGQTNGSFLYLWTLTSAKVTAGKANYGRLSFLDVNANLTLGGTVTLPGDPLDYGPSHKSFCARNGRNWIGVSNGTIADDNANAAGVNAHRVKYTSGGTAFGLYNSITDFDWRWGENFTVIMVYRATRGVNLRMDTGALNSTVQTIDSAIPAASDFVTYINFVQPATASAAAGAVWEVLNLAPQTNDIIEIADIRIFDAGFNLNSASAFRRLYKA